MTQWLTQVMAEALTSGSVFVYILIFAGGVVASFTPCTYPILPLTIGYIGGAAGGRRGRAFLLSLALVFGMALVYAIVGMIFAAVGVQFGALWANGWAVFAIAWFFLLMSLFLLDVFTFSMPGWMQQLQSQNTERGDVWGAILVGSVSGLVVGPCTGPILAMVLVAVATTLHETSGVGLLGAALAGGLKLFLFGFGQGALIILCGAFAGFISRLPKSGQWMVTVKKGFALLVMIGATLLLVYVGQATNFPDLTRLLAVGRTTAGEEKQVSPSSQENRYEGDEFLKE